VDRVDPLLEAAGIVEDVRVLAGFSAVTGGNVGFATM
jgi:hypothetical protein